MKTLLELEERECHYPVRQDSEGTLYCAEVTASARRRYCEQHYDACCTPSAKRGPPINLKQIGRLR